MPRAVAATTSARGWTGSRWTTTTSARCSTGRSPRPEPEVAIRTGLRDVALLAEARPSRRGAAAARGHGRGRLVPTDPRLRARLLEALGGVCWWQGDLAAMRLHYEEALALWLEIGDERELANAYYNAAFIYAIDATIMTGAGAVARSRGPGLRYLQEARRALPAASATSGARPTPCGPSATTHYFRERPDAARSSSARHSRSSARTGDRTMEAWALPHARERADRGSGDIDEATRPHRPRRPPLPGGRGHGRADARRSTTCRPSRSPMATCPGRRGCAARRATCGIETGTDLRAVVEDAFDQGMRPGSVQDVAGGRGATRGRGRGDDAGRGHRVRAGGRRAEDVRCRRRELSRDASQRCRCSSSWTRTRPQAGRAGRPRGADPDVRQLRCGDGRAQVQADLPVRLLPVLLRLLLIRPGRTGRTPRLDWPPMTADPPEPDTGHAPAVAPHSHPARRRRSPRTPAGATSG